MPSIVSGSIISGAHSNTYGTFVPSAGTDRIWLIMLSQEKSGATVADYFTDVVAMRGQTATELDRAFIDTGTARGVQVFAFNETQVAAIIAAGSGNITFDGGNLDSVYHPTVICLTLENTNQTYPTSYKVQGLNTAGTPADALPHQLTVNSASTGDLVMFFAHTSQASANAWTGATEVADEVGSLLAGSIATFTAVSNGNVTAGISPDGGISYATSIIGLSFASAGGANTDPVVSTPIPDISVQANSTGTIDDISANFSDADSDTLTYSVTPALPTGMTLNTSTGVITGDGSITVTAAANYTFSADDGQGGTPATDVVSIEVTAVVNAGLRLTLRDSENSNALIASETGLTVHIYDTDGGTELLTTTAETTDGSGVLEIDSDSIGNVDDTAFIVAKRSNGQTCCGTVTVINLDA